MIPVKLYDRPDLVIEYVETLCDCVRVVVWPAGECSAACFTAGFYRARLFPGPITAPHPVQVSLLDMRSMMICMF